MPCARTRSRKSLTVTWWMFGVSYQATGSSRVTGIRPPHKSASRMRQCAKLGKLTKARSEEHTSELQSLMRISYAVFCLKKKNKYHRQMTYYTETEDSHM